ncbi:MAG: zinc transporter [Rickettsiales bacterium]|jgi:zinc transporter
MGKSQILSSFSFKDGNSLELKNEDVALELKNNDLCWVHLDANNPESEIWLKKEVDYLDEIIIDALLAEETRSRLVEFESGSLIIFRGVNLNKNAKPEDMVSIRMWIDSKRIITIQKRNIKAIQNIAEEVKKGKYFTSAGEFVTDLCYGISDDLQTVIDSLSKIIDDAEDKTLDKVFDEELREDVTIVKKQAITLKRHIMPQKEVIVSLKHCKQSWISQADKRHLQENFEYILRYVEDLDEIKERSQVVHDEMISAISRKLNKNMYVISVLTAIFMPLTFITGLFGMNVGGIPFDSNVDGFWFITIVLSTIVMIQVVWSIKKWIKNYI